MSEKNETNENERKPYTIQLSDGEVAAVREITKVDAVAPGVVAIVRTAIEKHNSQKN